MAKQQGQGGPCKKLEVVVIGDQSETDDGDN